MDTILAKRIIRGALNGNKPCAERYALTATDYAVQLRGMQLRKLIFGAFIGKAGDDRGLFSEWNGDVTPRGRECIGL